MRMILVTPFRLPLSLPRDRLLASNRKWTEVAREARRHVDELGAEARLGNWGWGESRDVVYKAAYPSWYFHRHYLLRLDRVALSRESLPVEYSELVEALDPAGITWQCWLFGYSVAVQALELEIPDCGRLARCVESGARELWDLQDAAAQAAMSPSGPPRSRVIEALKWCEHRLATPMKRVDKPFSRDPGLLIRHQGLGVDSPGGPGVECLRPAGQLPDLFLDEHPIHNRCLRALWTHTLYSFTPEEIDGWSSDDIEALASLVPADQLSRLRDGEGDNFDWGHSSRVDREAAKETDPDEEYPEQWLEALVVIEFYYTCLEIADTVLPVYIAVARTVSEAGQHAVVLKNARRIRGGLRVLIGDYNDLQNKTAGEAHEVLDSYHENWRLGRLIDNLREKFDLLEELISTSSDAINKRSETAIEMILFVITLLSVVGLLTGLHDYLVGGWEARFPDPLNQAALGLGKTELILFSTLTMLSLLVFYLVYKLWRR